jgi:protein arginine kinase
MMRFSTLVKHPANWMTGKIKDNSVVITSRIRLARNLRDLPFPGWAMKEERKEILKTILPEIKGLDQMNKGFAQELSELDSLQKQVMVERHLISREQAARGDGCAAVVNRKQSLSLMVNEEDHLRMQSIFAGLRLREAYDLLDSIDRQLETKLSYAFDSKLGYITACPTNLGTGMRASAMLHLPALVLTDQISQVLQAVGKIGLAVRGLFGEGTESLGDLFQISNQSTLGESEEAIIDRLERVIKQVANHERNARLKMMEEDREQLSDKIGRAYGLLKHARLFDSKEAFTHISLLRLGADLGFFPEGTMQTCDELMMEIQPAHLQLYAGKELEPEKRDLIRAEIIRDQLRNLDPPAISIIENEVNNTDTGDELPIEPPID